MARTAQDLIDNPDLKRIHLIEIDAYSLDSGEEETLRFSDARFNSSPNDDPSNVIYKPRLSSVFNYEVNLFSGSDVLGEAAPSIGVIRIANNDGEIDHVLTRYRWDGRAIRLKLGGEGFSLSQFDTRFSGTVENIEWDEKEIRVNIRSPRTKVEKVIQDNLYDDTVNYADAEGRPIPLAYGHIREAQPQLIDDVDLIYQIHERSVDEIEAVYDKGIPLDDDGDVSEDSTVSSLDQDGILADRLDGESIYVLGTERIKINQVPLGRRWEIQTTKVKSPIEFDASDQAPIMTDATFKSDGTAMFIVDDNTNSVYQYSLSSAWDISTASFDSVSFDVSSETTNPRGLTFKSDGTAMFILNNTPNNVFQYSLSSAWDISTASYDSVSFDVSSEGGSPQGIAFKPDGTAMFIVNLLSGPSPDSVFQYSLSSAWDISTASYDSVSLDVSSEATAPLSIAFKPDGTAMFIIDNNTQSVFQYSLSSAWDISTASYDSVRFDASSEIITLEVIAFKSDGTTMFLGDSRSSRIYQYPLDSNSPWDLNIYNSLNVSSEDTLPQDIFVKPDGAQLYVLGNSNQAIYQYTLSLEWTVSSAFYSGDSFSLPNTATAIDFKRDGTKLYVLDSNASVNQYSLGTPWDISTASFDSISFDVSSEDSDAQDMFFRPNGESLFVLGAGTALIFQYSLSTAWDISTASFDSVTADVQSEDASPQMMFFKNEGDQVYVGGGQSNAIFQYFLSDRWDISTLEYNNNSIGINHIETEAKTLFFRTSGNAGGPLFSGGFFTDEANGTFRLGAQPEGTITVDLKGDDVGGYVDDSSGILERIVKSKASLTDNDLDQASFSQVTSTQSSTIGIYLTQQDRRLPRVLSNVMSSVGGFWTFNRKGRLQIGILEVPGSAEKTINETDVTGQGIRRRNTRRVVSKIRLGYDKTWTVQNEGSLALALNSDEKALRSNEYRFAVSEDSTIDTKHLLAETIERNTLIDLKSNAQTEADRLLNLLGTRRSIYRVPVGRRIFEFDVNDTITLRFDRFGFSEGVNFRIIGIVEDVSQNKATLILWG